jgi:Fic family protein
MSYTDKLDQIEKLKQAIEQHGKLATDVLNKINYKFRLEWNYTSNSMEGNSLTKQETRSVMVGNITVEGKPIKDVLEMKGHDEIIFNIIKMGKGELNISENRIKEIHKGIMHEEDAGKKHQIGIWKKVPNYLTNYKNERFDFIAPGEVHERMHQLINWLNTQKEKIQHGDKDALHPVQMAFQFHLDYITIHPFYDGNGRTVRILTNLILISYGYPPVYVKENEKGPYYQYLADIQGYGGAPDLFYEFMAGLLIRSLQIVLDAIEGKEIEEPDDVIKEISIWKQQLGKKDIEAQPKSNEKIVELYRSSLSKLFEKYRSKMNEAFHDLFASWEETEYVNNSGQKTGTGYIDAQMDRISKPAFLKANDNGSQWGLENGVNTMMLTIGMSGFKKDGINAFNSSGHLQVEFHQFLYKIKSAATEIEKLYAEKLTDAEIEKLVTDNIKAIFKNIKLNMKNPPLSEL